MTSQKIQNNIIKVKILEKFDDKIPSMTSLTSCKLQIMIRNRYLGDSVRIDLLHRGSGIIALNRWCILALHHIHRLQIERQELT